MTRAVCIRPWSGHVLNAAGLGNAGAEALLARNIWQQWTESFMLSWAAVGETPAKREKEIEALTELFRPELHRFKAPFAIQLNCGCPNTGRPDELTVDEIERWLQITSALGIPLVVNVSVVIDIMMLLQIASLEHCAALWIANTIPWGDPRINWRRLFGSDDSPLEKRGLTEKGGLSGPNCLPHALHRVDVCRQAGIKLPIIVGNGIQSVQDARAAIVAGADGIALGIVGMLRWWRLRNIIQTFQCEAPP